MATTTTPQSAIPRQADNLESGDLEKPEPLSQTPGLFSRRWILGPVSNQHADLVLLAHSLVTGMVDAASFSNWGVFCGMQTGMSVLPLLSLIFSLIPSTQLYLGSWLEGNFRQRQRVENVCMGSRRYLVEAGCSIMIMAAEEWRDKHLHKSGFA